MNTVGKTIASIGAVVALVALASNSDDPNPSVQATVSPVHSNVIFKTPIPTKLSQTPKPIPQAQSCHPSYSGACLKPNASDYDCAGGSGNGPYYTGTVQVVGPDVFGLDRDGDGWGCE